MSRPLRIAIDGRSLRGERTGVGTYAANLLEQLLEVDTGLSAIVVTDGELPPLAGEGSGRVRVVQTGSRSRNNFVWSNLALPHALRSARVDLFHSPGYTAPLRLPVPSVVSLHDVSYAAHPEWYPHAGGRLRALWYRASARRARVVLTISEFSRREILRVYGLHPERVRVIYLGVDLRRFRRGIDRECLEAVRRRWRLGRDFVLFVGDVHPRRNVARLVEAAGALRRSGPELADLQVVIAGRTLEGGRDYSAFEYVRQLGYVPDEELPLLYNAARAFVFPSFYEGFGLGVVEAMACGCPVIVARGTACHEIAGPAALTVDPSDTGSLVGAMAAVLGNPELAAANRAAGLEQAARFTWRRTAEETADVYRFVVGWNA
jgi:glycosyltransferase involved in cell wall biosynthesis